MNRPVPAPKEGRAAAVLRRWSFRLKVGGAVVGVVGAPIVIGLLAAPNGAPWIACFGGLCEVFALGAAAWEINKIDLALGGPGFWARFAPKRMPQYVELHGKAEARASMSGTLSASFSATAPLEDRVKFLEREIENLHAGVARVRKEARETERTLRRQLSALEATVKKEPGQRDERLKEIVLGDLGWAYAVVILLLGGVVCSTWSEPIAALFG